MVKIEPLQFCASMIDCNSVIKKVETTGKYKFVTYESSLRTKYKVVQDLTNGTVVQITLVDENI